MSATVPPAARARDAIALALVAAGAGAYFVAWRGMQALAQPGVTARKGEYLMTQWNSYHRLSRLGIAGMVAGVLVAAWSFQKLRRSAAPDASVPAPQPDVTPE